VQLRPLRSFATWNVQRHFAAYSNRFAGLLKGAEQPRLSLGLDTGSLIPDFNA
jgi:hypothetical protein